MSTFRIAAAQVSSTRGDLDGNIVRHLDAIRVAASQAVSVLVFPELSLMGYEPELAKTYELSPTDPRLVPVAHLAKQERMQVVAGASIVSGQAKPYLGEFIFGDDGSLRTYAKMHLGGSESSYFTAGNTLMSVESHDQSIGLSICADSSRRSHPAAYASKGATAYAASVFLNAEWYATDSPRFAAYAVDFGMLVLTTNHAASIGTLVSVGNSAAWAPDGSLIACAAGTQSALVVATRTGETWVGEVVRVR